MIIPLLLVATAATAGYMHQEHKIDNTRQDMVEMKKEYRSGLQNHEERLANCEKADLWLYKHGTYNQNKTTAGYIPSSEALPWLRD